LFIFLFFCLLLCFGCDCRWWCGCRRVWIMFLYYIVQFVWLFPVDVIISGYLSFFFEDWKCVFHLIIFHEIINHVQSLLESIIGIHFLNQRMLHIVLLILNALISLIDDFVHLATYLCFYLAKHSLWIQCTIYKIF
jgi:hypothetical protein